MPRLPTIVAEQGLDTNRSTQPRIQVDTSLAQAVSGLAGAAQDSVNLFQERYNRQQEQLKKYQTERSFQEFQNNVIMDSIQYEQEAQPGAPEFYKNWNDRYETARREWESTVPPDLLPEYQVKTEGYRGQIGANIARREVELRETYYETTLDQDIDGMAATAFNDPESYREVWGTIRDHVNLSGLNATKKMQRLQVYKEKLDEATVAGYLQQGKFDEARDFLTPIAPPAVLPQGQLEPGNIDLTRRPRVENPDGSVSTIRSMSVNIDGREVLLPTIADDGTFMTQDEAIVQYHKTGKHLGIFDTPEAATSAAKDISKGQDKQYTVAPNTLTEQDWNLQNYERWEFGGPEFEIDAPVARAMDILATASGRKHTFTAKKDSVKIRIDGMPDFEKNNMVLNARAAGFSFFAFSSTEKGDYVTLKVAEEGVSNRPAWLNPQTLVGLKSYAKTAGINSRYLPVGTNNARKLLKIIEDEEDRQHKVAEQSLKQVQTDIAKEGWTLWRNDGLTGEWLDRNQEVLSEEDFSQLTKVLMKKLNGKEETKAPHETDQTEYVDLMRRAINPRDETVISDAIVAQAEQQISKTDFNKIFDLYAKTTTDGALGKPAEWKKELRSYIMDKIKPVEESDTSYLSKRIDSIFEFDDVLKEHPDITRDDARKRADEIIKKHVADSNGSKRDTLPTGSYLGVGRYAITIDSLKAAALALRKARDEGTITTDQFNAESIILGEWSKLLIEESKEQ